MLLCLNYGHSEHKQKADVHGYSYWIMATFTTTSHWIAAHVDHSFATRYCNKHPCIVLLLDSVASHKLSPPWAGFLPGDHLRKSKPSMATIVGLGAPSTATQFARCWWSGGSVVAGTTCDVHALQMILIQYIGGLKLAKWISDNVMLQSLILAMHPLIDAWWIHSRVCLFIFAVTPMHTQPIHI